MIKVCPIPVATPIDKRHVGPSCADLLPFENAAGVTVRWDAAWLFSA